LCCACWALAALAELGVQGPESWVYRPVKFSAAFSAACIDVFPASRKRCEKFAFLARITRFFQIFLDVEMNVRIWHGKGVGCYCRCAFLPALPLSGNLDISS
jgi:hypothetical protein